MMKRLGLSVCLAFAVPCLADDWPHWRGPTRNGLTTEVSGWTKERWLADQPAWTATVGAGASSPIVVGESAYWLGHVGSKDIVRCLDTNTGKERWQQTYACPEYGRFHVGDEGLYSGPSATPEYDPTTQYLYTLGADGDLHCWDTTQQGKQRWQRKLYADYGVGRRPS